LPDNNLKSSNYDKGTMAPPSATHENGIETGASIPTNSHDKPQNGTAPLEPGLTEKQATKQESSMGSINWPKPPTFTDKYEERQYLKGRLALAFRIFAKFGFDEGVAGHITLRVYMFLCICCFTRVEGLCGQIWRRFSCI
jgi:hypothetical protein